MAIPQGYIPGPKIGNSTPIYNQYSGQLSGQMDSKGNVSYGTGGLENLPQTLAAATAGAQTSAAIAAGAQGGAGGAGGAAPSTSSGSAAFTGNYANAPSVAQSYLNTGNAPKTTAGSNSLYLPNGTALSANDTQQIMGLYNAYKGGDQVAGKSLATWMQGAGMDAGALDTAVTNMQQGLGPNASPAPETTALGQIAQIDPASETLRQAVANSYLTPLQQAQTPSAADYKTYLDQFKQLDPEEYAQRQGLATSMDSYLKQAQDQAALGSQLDPVTARQVEQQTRLGQAARGNVYGTPQMVEEAMTTGQAGLTLQQQRQAQLGTALGAQQSYLGSGLGLGDTAIALYNQQQQNLRAAQGGALSYLGSGQTPYQVGSNYVNQANMNAAQAAQGGPVYNPASLGSSYGAAQIPQYGLDIGQQSQNWYNSLQAYSGGQGGSTPNKGAQAAAGALGGAASGAMTGAAAGPYGALIGAGVGAVAGGVKGYYS